MTTWPVAWKLASPDRTLTADLMAGASVDLNGTITCAGKTYSVRGGWSGAHTIPGRNYSVFSLSGRTVTLPDVPNWISVVGMMTGPGEAPEKIDIRATVSSSADGTLLQYSGVLYSETMLDSFDHVVVLMLENRSFDNLLGYMYPNGVPADAPLGKTFEGVVGKDLSNPLPQDPSNPRTHGFLKVSPVSPGQNGLKANYFQPYPDPGETFDHVSTQLFNGNPLVTSMNGFVSDYFANYQIEIPGHIPTFDEYAQIMQCYTPDQVPVITKLAEQFGVFDHWFCAVPSQTWCNRAFWNAGTSWGHVNNGGYMSEAQPWFADSVGPTIFSQIQLSHSQIFGGPLNWMVYADSPAASLTHLIHFGNLGPYWLTGPFNHFADLPTFFSNCAAGTLPAYAFLEPRFLKPSNDMHPSAANSTLFGKGDVGSVLLGEHLIWQVYEAIRNSPVADRILLIICFDEHGGCYDHVPPPSKVTPPDLTGYTKEAGFNFDRLGVRVPIIMVSSHIAKNTIVNTPMHHGSFLKTVADKWEKVSPGSFPPLPPLTARVADAPTFVEVFTSPTLRPAKGWPVIPEPVIPAAFHTTDFSQAPLGHLEKSIIGAAAAMPHVVAAKAQGMPLPHPDSIVTVEQAEEFLSLLADVPKDPPEEVE